jgi:hypothetical protein
MIYTLDILKFRTMFPEYSDTSKYPDESIQLQWDMATCYIAPYNQEWIYGCARENAIYLMTAHLLALADKIASKTTLQLKGSSTIDKISVTMTPPPFKNQFQYWLLLTPRGSQLFALIQSKMAGGVTIGGLPERSAFRKVWGVF